MLTKCWEDTGKLSKHIKNLSDSIQDEWLMNVKNVLTTVSKCINSERYIEAAQLVFAVIEK